MARIAAKQTTPIAGPIAATAVLRRPVSGAKQTSEHGQLTTAADLRFARGACRCDCGVGTRARPTCIMGDRH